MKESVYLFKNLTAYAVKNLFLAPIIVAILQKLFTLVLESRNMQHICK